MNEQAMAALQSTAPRYEPPPMEQEEDEEMRLAIEASLREEEE